MLRTFHITHPTSNEAQGQLNVSECLNGRNVILGIAQDDRYAEIALTYHELQELCDLRYTLNITEIEPEQQEIIEETQLLAA